MTLLNEVIDSLGYCLPIIRFNQVRRNIEFCGTHSDITAAELMTKRSKFIIFGKWRKDQDPKWTLLFKEISDVGKHFGRRAVNWPYDESKLGVLKNIKDPLLEIENHLCIWIIVQQADQEIATQSQCTRLRIGNISQLGNDLLDLVARIFL